MCQEMFINNRKLQENPLVYIHLLFLWVLSAVLQASIIYDCKTTLKSNIFL